MQVWLIGVRNVTASSQLFYALKDHGAWLNGRKISCIEACNSSSYVLMASRSEVKRGEWDAFLSQHVVKPIGSIAYKLGLVAAGLADATFSLGPKNEWDIAAGVLLVKEAGGFVSNQCKEEFRFNQKNTLVNGIVAASSAIHADIFRLIERAAVTC